MKSLTSNLLSLLMFLLLSSCNDSNESVETIAPVSNIRFEAGNGEILFKWDNPKVPDLAYVEISYTDSFGHKKKTLTNKNFSQQLIQGIGDSKSYEFTFLAYSNTGKISAPVTIMANAKEPLLNIFNGKLKITTDFGGVYLSWDNIYDEEFYIGLEYTDINGNDFSEEVLVPANATGAKFIAVASNLQGTQTINIYTTITDSYGNKSTGKVIKFFKLEAGRFDRSTWIVTDKSSQSGAAENVLDDKASTMWENEWGSGTHVFPHFLCFDLGGKKRIEKAEFLHRPGKIEARGIQLWGNNKTGVGDSPEWQLAGSFDMDQDDRSAQIFELPAAVEYRYIKIVFTTPGKDDSKNAAISEFALYGQDLAEE